MNRIVVFTSDLNFTVRKGIVCLLDERPQLQILVLYHQPAKTLRRLIRNQLRNLRRNGWRWIPYQAREIVEIAIGRLRRGQWHSAQRPGANFSVDSLRDDSRITIRTYPSIHSPNAIRCMKEFNPDLGISLAAPILEPALFETPSLGTINLHKGKVPDYRGMPPAFWEMWNGEEQVGCTVHKVEEGLDTGDVLAADTVDIERFSTPHGLRLRLDEIGFHLVCSVVDQMASGSSRPSPQTSGGRTYTKPTLAEIATLKRRLIASQQSSATKQLLKSGAVAGYRHALRPLVRAHNRMRNRREIIVLLYHRVSDEFRDGVTAGLEQFEQQMSYVADHYPIASIDDVVLGRIPQHTNGKPIVAVTFDDGYRDNYENAVPIMLRYQIPAAFFVSTGMIGREVGFAHDLSKLGRTLPNMTWDQLREMRDLGFIIGSHTVSHLNCAKADIGLVREELLQSKRQLEQELGLDDVYFAYPFGGRGDMTSTALSAVRDAGYSSCLSAYGGVNRGLIDPYNVLRMGVSSGFHLSRFAARLEGW